VSTKGGEKTSHPAEIYSYFTDSLYYPPQVSMYLAIPRAISPLRKKKNENEREKNKICIYSKAECGVQ